MIFLSILDLILKSAELNDSISISAYFFLGQRNHLGELLPLNFVHSFTFLTYSWIPIKQIVIIFGFNNLHDERNLNSEFLFLPYYSRGIIGRVKFDKKAQNCTNLFLYSQASWRYALTEVHAFLGEVTKGGGGVKNSNYKS